MKLSLYKGIFMKTVFLHIGLPKTGTTALQSFLRANEAALARSGICFPDLGFRYPNILANRNAHFLIASYDTAPHTASFTPQEEYYTALDRLAALSEEYGKILLSDELIWRICNRHSDFLPTVKQDLASRGMELKVIVYLRRQDEFVQSRYRQRIKTGETFSFYEFLDTLRQNKYPLDFYDSLNKISDAIGRDNLIIRIYEKCQYEGFGHTLCSDFLTIFDLSVSDGFTESERTMNRSLSGTYLEIRRRFRRASVKHRNLIFPRRPVRSRHCSSPVTRKRSSPILPLPTAALLPNTSDAPTESCFTNRFRNCRTSR